MSQAHTDSGGSLINNGPSIEYYCSTRINNYVVKSTVFFYVIVDFYQDGRGIDGRQKYINLRLY